MARPSSPVSDYRGARGSNAGDQFHELWALQRALELLDPSSAIQALTVEGVASETPENNANAWDGVDCGLYFGASTLEAAERIELAQLKYSSANPGDPWSIAALSHNTKARGNNSVLRRLADAFSEAKSRMRPDAELRVRLVSNRPIADEVLALLSTVQQLVAATDSETTVNLAKVRTATGLGEADFVGFAKALDLTDCGSPSRFSLRNSITTAVAEILGGETDGVVRELMSRIRDLMMPEAARDIITRRTVLGWFDVANEAALFPAPGHFKSIPNPIPRQPAKRVEEALSTGNRVICLHGEAGCGKTTTLLQLQKAINAPTVMVLFDCYGAGTYLFSNDRRHLPENAFLQITNELSLKAGVPFMLPRQRRTSSLIVQFMERLTAIARLIEKTNPAALLIVGIDAADNSVTASLRSEPADACFVNEIANANLAALPPNVRFVFSARTGRKETLALPSGTQFIPCGPFELAETKEFARQALSGVSDDWIAQFHALSNGIPRVQDYAISAGSGSPDATLISLRPHGKSLPDVLAKLFKDAASKIGDSSQYSSLMAGLASLPAPIPRRHLAAVLKLNQADVDDFIRDTQPSLRMDDEGISIADEDVEDFIRQEGADRRRALQDAACSYFSSIYKTDTYAATHYADLLVAVGRESEILPIIEEDLTPAAIADPIARREVQLQRLRLALIACRRAKNTVESARVLLLSAEASKEQDFLTKILADNTDLAIRFARSSLVRLILSDPERKAEQGRVLVQDAARFARIGNRIQAREQLYFYSEWLTRRSRVAENDRHQWPVEDGDIESLIEAALLLAGTQRAYDNLCSWRPRHIRLAVALKLIPSLIRKRDSAHVSAARESGAIPRCWDILLLVPLSLSGVSIAAAEIEQSLRALRRKLVPPLNGIGYAFTEDRWKIGLLETIVTGCEIAYSKRVPFDAIRLALSLVCDFSIFDRQTSRVTALPLDVLIRAWLLYRKVSGENGDASDFLNFIDPAPEKTGTPAGKKVKNTSKRVGDRLEEIHRRIVQSIFPVYASRLVVLEHCATQGSVTDIEVDAIAGFGSDEYYFERSTEAFGIREAVSASVLRLMHLHGANWERLYAKASKLATPRFDDPFATRLRPLWGHLLLRSDTHDFVLQAISSTIEGLKRAREPASEKVAACAEFSRLALNFSDSDAQIFFEQAVAFAQEIDREAYDQIRMLARLSSHAVGWKIESCKAAAGQVADIFTDIAERLRNEEHFPWSSCIRTITKLHAPTATAVVSRWADQGIQSLDELLPSFISEMHRSGRMTGAIATALLSLLPDVPNELSEQLLQHLKNEAPNKVGIVTSILASDCLLREKPESILASASRIVSATALLPLAKESQEFERLERSIAFLGALPVEPPERQAFETGPTPELDARLGPFITPQAIEDAIAAARAAGGYFVTEGLLMKMRETIVAPADRVAFLDAISRADVGHYSGNSKGATILDALQAWSDTPSVSRWCSSALPAAIVANFSTMAWTLNERDSQLPALLLATGLPAQERGEIILDGIETTGLKLGSRTLFKLSELRAATMSSGDAWLVFDWYLQRLRQRTSPPPNGFEQTEMPADETEALGRLLFALLGDIDQRIRWRAAHCMRRLGRIGATNLLDAAYSNFGRSSDAAFRDPDAPYYWIASKQWAVISAARISLESPAALTGVQPTLLAAALDKKFPHVVIREYAKKAVIALHTAKVCPLGGAALAKVQAINKSPFRRSRARDRQYMGREDRSGRRFSYGMDTIEYVLSPVLRLFSGLTGEKVLRAAERWLVDEWKAPKNVNWWDHEARKRRYDERRYLLWSDSKGSVPLIQRYGNYLETHAAACVVGEFLAKYPLTGSADEYDSFERWIKKYSLSVPPAWLADLREPKPLQSQLWSAPRSNESAWVARVSQRDFLAALLPSPSAADKFMTTNGSWVTAFSTREIRTEVSSALVEPGTASALLRALRGSDRTWAYRFPDDNDDYQLVERPYRLLGLVRNTGDDKQLDSKDTLTNGIEARVLVPGDMLRRVADLRPAPPPRMAWTIGKSPELAVQFMKWSDLPETYDESQWRQRQTKSSGEFLQIRSDVLESFLNQVGLDLIAAVHIERRLENEYGNQYSDKTRKAKAFEEFFILRADGKLENYAGAIGSWRHHRSAARSTK